MTSNLDGITPLPHLGVIRAEGDDAAKFLHGQLTQDFVLLGLNEARLAAFFWVQSLVRCQVQRRMLYDLDQTISALRERDPEAAEVVSLTGHYHNLLRMWAET